jgi:hypothetical protein
MQPHKTLLHSKALSNYQSFLDVPVPVKLEKTGKNAHSGSFFNEVIIHDFMMQNKKKVHHTRLRS